MWDERFRTIKVKVDQPGVKLIIATATTLWTRTTAISWLRRAAATTLVQPTTMATAMLHGGPDPTEILFKVRIRPADAPPADTPLKTNQTNPDPKVKVEGPFKAYGVDLVPDAKAVTLPAEAQTESGIARWRSGRLSTTADGEKLVTASNRLHTAC